MVSGWFDSARSVTKTGAMCLALAVISSSGFAQEAKPEVKAAEAKQPEAASWVVNCSSGGATTDLECQVSQNLTEAKTGQRVLTLTVRRQGEKGELVLLLALPHGLFLPSGVSYQIDGGEKATAAVQTSDQNGAYAAVPLSSALLGGLKSGTTLNIGMEAVTRKPLTIPVPLKGFTAAVDKMLATK